MELHIKLFLLWANSEVWLLLDWTSGVGVEGPCVAAWPVFREKKAGVEAGGIDWCCASGAATEL